MTYKIAIADNNNDFLLGLHSFFDNRPGYEVVGATNNGKDLLCIIEKERPDILLTDCTMPILDGVDILKELNNREYEYYAPHIIMMSTILSEEYIKSMRSLGADYFFLKPFDYMDLCKEIESYYYPDLSSFYLDEAIKIVSKDEKLLENMDKNVYPIIAEMYNTTIISVEKNIKKAIKNMILKTKFNTHMTDKIKENMYYV